MAKYNFRKRLIELFKMIRKNYSNHNCHLRPAQRMYESVGFKVSQKRKNESNTDFSGEYIEYAIIL